MCGVIGYTPGSGTKEQFLRLLQESRIRGLHAFGIWQPSTGVHRTLGSTDGALQSIVELFDPSELAIAHARYSTSGDWRVPENNQPLVVDDMAMAFNGVIHMGTREEFSAAHGVQCETDNDGEVFLRLLEAGCDASSFLSTMMGSFAGVWWDGTRLFAGRNERRPLWRCGGWYASARDIFLRAGFSNPSEVPVGVWVA